MQSKETKEHISGANSQLISIITPLYNAEAFIAETIQSVLNQTYTNWEQIIVDDASTDESLAIARSYAEKDKRFRIESLSENKGAAFCRNHATELANGSYIAFLDSDDLWHSEKLERQLQFMKQHNCDVCYTSYRYCLIACCFHL